MNKKLSLVFLLLAGMVMSAAAQHNMSSMNMAKDTVPKKPKPAMQMNHMNMRRDTVPKKKAPMPMNGMKMRKDTVPVRQKPAQMDHMPMDQMPMDQMNRHQTRRHMGMPHYLSLNLPMERNGSGTAWLPDASPMYGYMFHTARWMYMLHGNAFLRYDNQDFTNKGSRGDTKVDVPDWLMFMGQRKVGLNGLFHFSTMMSLDAPFGGGAGYPLLFQSGEAYHGKPIVDRQHPHDLFSELSVSYSEALSEKSDVYIYVGYPGEPALGPVAFMHRPSAMDNPDAPLSHHWVDATHISFGVATLGVRYGDFKIEGSSFTGREPNDNRYNFDKPLFDSWSGRLSYNPTENWALQVSHGFIKSPEELHPGEDVNRTTASAIFSTSAGANSTLNATAVWGLNKTAGHNQENAVMVEGQWRANRLALHSRYEWVQKSSEELALDENLYGHDVIYPVNALTLGFNYDLLRMGNTNLAAGSQISFYHAPPALNSLYGKNPMALEVYLRLYPAMMKMHMR